MKKHRKLVLGLVAAALAAGALWYSRPVDIYGLTGLTSSAVNTISFSLRQFDSHAPGGTIDIYGSCTPENPEWDAIREAVESLRFRRPPWNLPLQFLDSCFSAGRQTKDGAYHIILTLIAQGGGYVNLQFFLDEWTYSSPWSNRNLALWVEDSRETGNALAETLWPLLEESQTALNVSRETFTRYSLKFEVNQPCWISNSSGKTRTSLKKTSRRNFRIKSSPW